MPQNAKAGPTCPVVLVVEDEPMVRILVIETLEENGYITHEAADAPSALEILKAPGVINLLVTDITLPGRNGYELAKDAMRLRPAMKVLFMTGYAYSVDLSIGGTRSGGTDVITKPFSLDGLARKVSAIIED